MKQLQINFDPNRPELIAKMREIDRDCRISNKEVLAKFLAKTYQ